jgi:hypothetical protein
MVLARSGRRRITLLGLVLMSSLIPACTAPNGEPRPWLRPFQPGGYVAQRPTYDAPGERPFYLGGYAGHDYGPEFRSRPVWAVPAGAPSAAGPRVSVGQGTWDPE